MALSVAFGMVLASLDLFSFQALFLAALVVGLSAVLLFRSKASGVLVYGTIVLIAASRFMLSAATVSEADIRQLQERMPMEQVRLEGRVAGIPKFYPYRRGEFGSLVAPFRCERMLAADQWTRLRGRIQLRLLDVGADHELHPGQTLLVSGQLQRRLFPGGEPFELTVADGAEVIVAAGAPPVSFRGWGERLRAAAAGRLSKGIENHSDQLAVYKALLLGYRKAIPAEINSNFSRTGTLHIFAISGLHVGMVGLLMALMLKAAGISRDKWGLLLIPLLLIYVVSTGMKSSAMRAFTMTAVYFVAPLFRRKPDVPSAVAVAALLLLFCDPLQIGSVGFIYSFMVVGFIVMFFAVVPQHVVMPGGGWLRGVWAYVTSLALTSVAAFLASTPLSALYFGLFSPISLLGNLVVVPLTFGVVLCGWLAILIPFATEIFNHAALVFINGLLGSVGLFSAIPGAYGSVPAPPLAAVGLWYVGWAGLFTHGRRQRKVCIGLILSALLFASIPFLF